MHRTPPDEDEQAEYFQNSYPRQKRGNLARPKQSLADQREGQQIEAPRIRRASLGPGGSSTPSALPASSTPRRPASSTAKLTRAKRPAPITANLPRNEKPDEDPSEQAVRSGQHTTSKIMVAQRRRPTIYEPPPITPHHTRGRRRRQRSMLTLLQDLSHNRTFLIVGTVLLVTLIMLPVIAGVIVNGLQHTTSTVSGIGPTPGSSQDSQSGSSIGVPPPDPHELVITPQDTDHPAPSMFATSAYLLDADTGATLYAHNPFLHLPMLSTTKLMTAVLAVEQGKLDQRITITPAIDHDISQLSSDSALMPIKKGETYTLRELLYGLLLKSGNDAALAIADTIGGNVSHFVAMMNQRAGQLGLHDTHYMNPHGLLMTGQFSSTHDLALLGRYSLSIPLIHQISASLQYHIVKNGDHPENFLFNGNQFLWWYPGADGGKTGYDGGSNFIQVVSCTRNHHHLIGVVMHSVDWWTDMRDLMNWGFDSFTWISPYDVDFQHAIVFDNLWDYFSKDKREITIPTANQGRYYIYTGYSISGPTLAYFDKGGGLKKFGYPTGLPVVSGTTLVNQRFERGTIQCDVATKQCKTI